MFYVVFLHVVIWTEGLREVYINVKQAFGISMFKTEQKI